MVRELLLDIWLEIPETARRVRQRIGAVIDWSVEAGHRETPLLLPSAAGLPKQARKKNHHAALLRTAPIVHGSVAYWRVDFA
jgi:hypothetical protein